MKILKIMLLILTLITSGIINTNSIKIIANTYTNEESYQSRVIQGKHKVVDDVGNNYYHVNNSDIGNPTTNGYGDFRVYYKNNKQWKFKYKGETIEETIKFIVLDKEFNGIHKDSIVFCIEPLKIAEWIDNTDESQSAYNKLSEEQQKEINKLVSLGISNFIKTGNFDFLSTTQMLIWEEIGVDFISFDDSLKEEKNTLLQQKNNYDIIPSFLEKEQTYNLTYNEDYGVYDLLLTDENQVLDEKYIDQLIGDYGNYHVQKGQNKNQLYIWNKQEDSGSLSLKATYNPLPKTSGYKLGVYYNVKPKFINSGQDLVTGLSYNSNINLNVKLSIAKGKATLKKCIYNKNDECNLQQGIEFSLFTEKGDLIEKKKTDENGYIEFDNLSIGRYYIQETNTLEGYVLDNTKYHFSIIKDGDIVNINEGEVITNNLIKGKVDLYKSSDKGLKQCKSLKDNCNEDIVYLKGVEFKIYEDKNNNKILDEEELINPVQTLTTNEDGYAISENLYYGNYILKETKTLSGYELSNKIYPFSITRNNQLVHINNLNPIVNKQIKNSIEVIKVDEDNKRLEGVEFIIYKDINNNEILDDEEKESENIVDVLITDNKGYAKSKELEYGSYIMIEKKTSDEYELLKEEIYFEINENSDKKPIVFNIVNNYKKSKIKVIKKSNNEQRLQGADFSLYEDLNNNQKIDPDEKIIQKGTTDANGEIIFNNIKYGSYIIKETKPPQGYKINNTTYPVQVKENEHTYEVEVYNQKIVKKLIKAGKNKSIIFLVIITLILIFLIYKIKTKQNGYI